MTRIMKQYTDLEEISTEIEGISHLILVLADMISQNDGGLTPNALESAFYAVESHLQRIAYSIQQIGQEGRTGSGKEKLSWNHPEV